MANNSAMIRKLQTALNAKGDHILYNTSQFYSTDMHRPITLHSVKRALVDEDTGKVSNVELFKSSSMIQVVLFLRDLLYATEGKEIPNNNEIWNQMKAQYEDKKRNNYYASTSDV